MNIRHPKQRSGNVLVFASVLMVALFAAIAFAVDLGYLYVVRSELQRTADATALAAAWQLWDEEPLTGDNDLYQSAQVVRDTANQYANLNIVAGGQPSIAEQDVEIGYLQPDDSITQTPTAYVAVRTRIRKTEAENGLVPLYFAKVLGVSSADQVSEATAVFVNGISRFGEPSTGENLEMLPFALDKETWDALLDGTGDDNWKWNEDLEQVEGCSDEILEVNLFPQATGAPGNRGTVDIGNNNNSTNDIKRQILYGISAADLAYHGGSLEFDENGELLLNGDTGISAAVKTQLSQIIGQPRIIPIFSDVQGPGNNAWYTIVEFVGVRIMEVKLTGSMSSKRVIIQPAKIISLGVIPGDGTSNSTTVYSPVWLVR